MSPGRQQKHSLKAICAYDTPFWGFRQTVRAKSNSATTREQLDHGPTAGRPRSCRGARSQTIGPGATTPAGPAWGKSGGDAVRLGPGQIHGHDGADIFLAL